MIKYIIILIFKFLNIQILIEGEEKLYDSNLIISNHISEMDIPILLALGDFRFVSADNLHSLILNIGTYLGCIIIGKKDPINDIDRQFNNSSKPLIIFPEGTLFFKDSYERNERNKKYKNVLAPKTKGYYHLIKDNKKVVDITLIYDIEDFSKAITIQRFFEVAKTRTVKVLVKTYDINTKLEKIFEDKDNFLNLK